MKSITLLTILLVCISSFASAQLITAENDLVTQSRRDSYENIYGTPYTSEEFRKASLDNTEDETYMIRYDAYQDALQFIDDNDSIEVIPPSRFYRFDFVEEEGAYLVVIYPKLGNGFGFLLWENESGVQLIRKETVQVERGAMPNGYNKPASLSASFGKIRYSYYLRKKRYGELVMIPHRRKKRAVYFFGKEIAKVAKQKKLDLKKEEDLVMLLKLVYEK